MEQKTASAALVKFNSTEEMLRAFCAVTDVREHLRSPIRRDGYLYATNGHICIVIKDNHPSIYGNESDHPDFGFIHRGVQSENKFVPLYIALPPSEKCKCCDGSGKLVKCKSCDGEGEFEHRGRDYECKECDGDGYFAADPISGDETIPCWNCDGSKVNPYQIVRVGHTTFARRYIAMLQRLPGIEIWTNPNHPMASAFFKFDGGFGAVMPCREIGK